MARTLQNLKEIIEQMIEEQGKNAPVAAFIFTQHDVADYDEDLNVKHYPMDVVEEVLNNVEEDDYIIEQVFERIGMELSNVTV